MKTVAGIFDSKVVADSAIASLLDEGFSKNDISLLMSEKARTTLFDSTDNEANNVAKGGITGAAIGGALGGLLAGLTSVGVIFIPGVGLLAAGPIIAALSGAGIGATVGGLSGALIRAGFAADEANRFESEIQRGKAVVIVHANSDDKAAIAESALRDSGALTKAA